MPASIRLLLCLTLISSPVLAQEKPLPSEAELATAKQEADKFLALRDQHEKLIDAQREQLIESQRLLNVQRQSLKDAEETVAKAEETLKPLKEALTKAEGEAKPLIEAAEKAAKEAEDAKGTDEEKAKADAATKAQEAAKPKQKAVEDAKAALAAAETKIAQSKQLVASQPAEIKQVEESITGIRNHIAELEKKHDDFHAKHVSHLKTYQRGMIAQGKMVSFAESVAPIFAQRCLACHNARTAKGRYNMENYANIVKGGESGVALEAGDGESSLLHIMVEDGSMPKDADPLKPEQIATIKKWIDTGAMLDAGVSSSAELITIMPKLPQPTPPETYRVTLPVTALAFSPDGKQLASSGYHEILLWNPETGELVKRISNLAERIYDIEFSPDGKRIAVAAGTPAQIGEAKIFSVESGELLADLVRTGDSVFAVSFSPDGSKLAIGCADRSIRLYDTTSWSQQTLIEDHADWVTDLAWSPDGTKLASASRDKTSKVFDAAKGESLVTFNSHNNTVSGVVFTPDNKQVVTSGADRQLRVWNVSDAKQVRNIGGFGDEIFELVASKEGDVYSVSADKNARQHTIASGKAVKAYSGHQDWVYSLARATEAKRIATGSYDGEIRVWNEADGKVLKQWVAAPGYAPTETATK